MRRLRIIFRISAVAIALFNPANTHAAEREIGVGAVAGFPSLAGIRLQYSGVRSFQFGVGYGFFPINSILQSKAAIQPISMDLGLSDSYSLRPSATYSLTNFHLSGRWFPGGPGFFTQLEFQQLRASASLSANLRNDTAGTQVDGLVTGNVTLTQPIIGPSVGYQFQMGPAFLDFSLGLGVLMKTQVQSSIGGTVANILPLVPSAEQSFEDAKQNLREQVENAVANAQSKVHFLPTLGIGFGVSF